MSINIIIILKKLDTVEQTCFKLNKILYTGFDSVVPKVTRFATPQYSPFGLAKTL